MRHPLHPALVHFPIACWTLAVAADVAFAVWPDRTDVSFAPALLTAGCSMALVAMLAGMIELPRVPEGIAMKDAFMHMGLMLTAFTLFTLRLFLGLEHLKPLAPDMAAFMLDGAGFITLGAGGWFGGRLVYTHGVGVAK